MHRTKQIMGTVGAVLVMTAAWATGTGAAHDAHEGYQLVWADEFETDGPGALPVN